MSDDWRVRLREDVLPWLLERDAANPGVRYFVLLDLLDHPADDPEVSGAQAAVMRTGPVPVILKAQYPQGYWFKPGPGHSPRYRATLWSVIFLSQLGADGRDERVRRAVEHVFTHAQTERGAFSCNGQPATVSHCLWSNVARALLDLGYGDDPRLVRSVNGLARAVVDQGFGHRPHTEGAVDADFACQANHDLPRAWGAVWALWALDALPQADRTSTIEHAIATSVDFLLGYALARGDWSDLGYPLAYAPDLLLALEALIDAGCARDPRLDQAVERVLAGQGQRERWRMEHSFNGKMWADVEEEGQPSKWVTLRAARTLKKFYEERV